MADTKISALTDGATANATDRLAAARAGANVYVTPAYIKDYILGLANTWTGAQTFPAGTDAAPSIVFSGITNTGFSTQNSDGENTIGFSSNGVLRFTWGTTGLRGGSTQTFNWSSQANPAAGAADTGIGRNAAGVVEANNGTQGTLRDLKSRSLITPRTSELTIATGVITVTGGYHDVDTEADGATDDLDTINGGVDGMILTIRANNDARTVVVKDGTGNLQIAGDHTMDNTQDTITLRYDGTLTAWLEIGRAASGA